nr:MAG TPA: hypothetical protein [Bacteriophage sp.]
MITKNFMACIISKTDTSLNVSAKKVDGEYITQGYGNIGNFLGLASGNGLDYSGAGQSMRLLFGSGNSSASIDDYKLENLITDYSVLTHSKTSIGTYDTLCTVFSRTIEANSNITIKEYGVVSVDNNGNTLLLAREVLPEPVVLQPGEKHTFTMTISLE